MKSQLSQHGTPTFASAWNSQAWSRIVIATLVCLLLAASCRTLLAQENFLVATQDGTFSLYDLTSLSLLESFQSAPLTYTIVSGPNPRLAYSAGGAGYGVATDTSIGRDIVRFKGVRAPASTISSDGKYYLAADYNYVLDVVDTATLQVVQTVDFSSVIPRIGNPGAIVAANNQAYIFPRSQNPSAPRAAVVNLSNFQLSSISLPPGNFCRRCASRTPDGSMLVVIERESSDHKTHVLLISTATNTIVHDFQQSVNYSPNAFVVTRSTDPNNLYGYAGAGGGSVLVVDLRPNSQTYGQFLASTSVTLPNLAAIGDVAISSDGSRLILAGDSSVQPPSPNVDVVDTAKMLSDPAHALIAQLTVNNGVYAYTVCTGFFPTTPPNTAPTVSALSTYQITNDQSNDITITGTNFQSGALVRIGSLPQLPTTFLGATMLGVHVPKQVPAGEAQDIIVTNPQTNDPPDQQNQSGLLAGKFNILPNPKFLPTTQFGTSNTAIPYVYELNQQTMVAVSNSNPGDIPYGMVFNVDGKELYVIKSGFNGYYVLPIELSTNTPDTPILLSDADYIGQTEPIAAGLDPQKGTPVIYVLWFDTTDLHLSKIDSDSSSKTYNTIVQTFNAGLSGNYLPDALTITLTPDGKYAYVWYDTDQSYLGIFNLTTGGFTSVTASSLGISIDQSQIGIAPDGKSMLLSTFYGNRTRIKVFDISNPISPKSIAEITPIPIPRRGFPYVNNYQVIGNKLYAIDLTGAVVVFNFDRVKGDFRERGYVASDSTENYSAFGFSADGAYFYAADYFSDLVLVADTSKLEKGGDPSLTNIRSPYSPYLLAISPVPPPMKAATAKHSGGQHGMVQPQRINGAGVQSQ